MAPVDTALEAANKEWTLQEYPGEGHSFLCGTPNNPAVALQAYRDAEDFVHGHIAAEPGSYVKHEPMQIPAVSKLRTAVPVAPDQL